MNRSRITYDSHPYGIFSNLNERYLNVMCATYLSAQTKPYLMMKKFTFLLACSIVSVWAQKPEPVDTALIAKIKTEGFNRSKIMANLSMLTDVHGPRLT